MSDYTHEDYERDKALVWASVRSCNDCAELKPCADGDDGDDFPCTLALGRILAHHAAQLAEVRTRGEKVAKEALRDAVLDYAPMRCAECKMMCDLGPDFDATQPCEDIHADYYYDRAEARS